MTLSLSSCLSALQQADSFFPSGAGAWSWGLETLMADARLETHDTSAQDPAARRRLRGARHDRSARVRAFVEDQLRHRWASFDRAFLHAAWHRADDLPALLELDAQIEALTLAQELRLGSSRVGQSLLGVHSQLDTPGATQYLQQVTAGLASGHLPVVQGLLWRQLGMQCEHCHLAAAYGLCTGLVSAALRLGLIGHLDAQRVLTDIHPLLLELLTENPPDFNDATSFTPMAEIAVMRHETQALRLFAN
ncbi:MAG TPA: urease accessory UreF family protein [Pseudomonas sp.]|uniref:urease accessory protein UreF n=1 Tax=Pseudomonas sp. TaxID=306 RepID=UPI002ED9D46A